jgi:hypothetical protein
MKAVSLMRTTRFSRRLSAAVMIVTLAAAAAACSSSTSPTASSSGMPGMGMSGMPNASASASASAMAATGMSASDPMYTGTGLSASDGGFSFAPVETTLAVGSAVQLHFKITNSTGNAVTAFEPDQTELMHLYLIHSDLTGFQHVHPTMAADGTWTADFPRITPGSYRAYVAFNAKNASGTAIAEVLSKTLTAPGARASTPLPAVASTTSVDGYTLSVGGAMMAAMSHTLTVTVSKNGRPVTDLQPYLETYAHLTAIHAGDLAFAHLHPEGAAATSDTGGPTLTFQTMMPEGGDWRVFIQFQTGGILHTAAITLHVG